MLKTGAPFAVVTALDQLTALGTVRSLAGAGVPVIGLTGDRNAAAARTNKCRKVYQVPRDGEQFVAALIDLGSSLDDRAVLFPTSDAHVLVISENRERLAPYFRFGLPDKQFVRLLMHKTEFPAFALRHGFNIPRTFTVGLQTDVREIAASVSYPCLLKPTYRTPNWDSAFPADKAFRLDDPEALQQRVSECLKVVDSLVIQEWIGGSDSDVYFCLVYFDDASRPAVSFCGRKIRQWVPETGSTASAVPVVNEEIERETLRLFETVRFKGLGGLEFKRDSGTGIYKITEPTVGRPDLQSYVATANGVNVPYIAYRSLIGAPVEASYGLNRRPVKWINEWAEYEAVRYHINRGELTVKEWYRSIKGPKAFGLFSLSDPLPFMYALMRRIRIRLRRRL